jgi:hypothetical protein
MLLGVLQFSRPPAVDSLSVTEAYHQLVGPKGLVNAETGQVDFSASTTFRNHAPTSRDELALFSRRRSVWQPVNMDLISTLCCVPSAWRPKTYDRQLKGSVLHLWY